MLPIRMYPTSILPRKQTSDLRWDIPWRRNELVRDWWTEGMSWEIKYNPSVLSFSRNLASATDKDQTLGRTWLRQAPDFRDRSATGTIGRPQGIAPTLELKKSLLIALLTFYRYPSLKRAVKSTVYSIGTCDIQNSGFNNQAEYKSDHENIVNLLTNN